MEKFKKDDRVRHMSGNDGRVTSIKPDGAVCVAYDKGWHGEYDDFWFRMYPSGLTQIPDDQLSGRKER